MGYELPARIEAVEHERGVLPQPRGEHDHLEGFGCRPEQLVGARPLEDVEGDDAAVDGGVDREVVALGWGVSAGVDQGLVEVQKDGLFLRERRRREPGRRGRWRRRLRGAFDGGGAEAAEAELVGVGGVGSGTAEDSEAGEDLDEAAAAGADGAVDGGLEG